VLNRLQQGLPLEHEIWGAVIVRGATASSRRATSIARDRRIQEELALRGRALSEGSDITPRVRGNAVLEARVEGSPRETTYPDSSKRTWTQRVWTVKAQDLVMVSLARDLPGGYVVLTRVIPTAYEYASLLQLKVVANLVFACEEQERVGSESRTTN
jgi:hypothetical protein